jgi:hypothetical protein
VKDPLAGDPRAAARRLDLSRQIEEDVLRYLQGVRFSDQVMARILELSGRSSSRLAWGVFALLNLVFLLLCGASLPELVGLVALQPGLGQFFFLFLGITLLGGVVGFVLSLDTTWLDSLLHRDV